MRVVVMVVGVVGMGLKVGAVRREVGRVVEVVGRVRVNEAVLLAEVVWAAERAAEVRAAEVAAAARALLREEREGLRRWTEDADNNVTRVLSSLQILVQPDGSVKRLKE